MKFSLTTPSPPQFPQGIALKPAGYAQNAFLVPQEA